jgi:hypothetical protein
MALAALLALTLLSPAAAVAGAAGDPAFTPQELRRLELGQLVERRVIQHRGELRLMGGTSWQVIGASPDAVWNALLDTEHYPRMMPQLSEAKIVESAGDNRTIFMRHGGSIAQKSYYLDVHLDRTQRDITFRVDEARPRNIRAAWGFYAVRPYPSGKALLVYGVMADIGDGLVAALLRSSVHEWMMKVPWMVKRFVEGGRAMHARR